MARYAKDTRRNLWARASERCHYCAQHVEYEASTIDHIVPRAFGGPDSIWNLVISCESCNGTYADAVRKCPCLRCRRAVNRFHSSIKNAKPVREPKREVAANSAPKSTEEVATILQARRDRIARKLLHVEDVDSPEAAALRGARNAFQQAIDLVWRVPVAPVAPVAPESESA